MNFLSKLFASKKAQGGDLAKEKLSLSHAAVTQYLESKISEQEMLARLMDGFIIIPLAEEPEMEGDKIKRWNPAIVEKADGSQWQVVFTNSEANSAFGTQNNYLFGLKTGTTWILSVLPPERGLMFNIGTAHYLEWSAEGIAKTRSNEFDPTNTLEVYLQRGCAGEISTDESLSVLVESDLYMPSATECEENLLGFVPFVFNRDGQSRAAVFTNPKLMDIYKDKMKGSVVMKGGELLSRIAPGLGIVINPGYRIGMEIDEQGIKDIVQEFVKNKKYR